MSLYKLITNGTYPPQVNCAFRDVASHPPYPAFNGWDVGQEFNSIAEPSVGNLLPLPQKMILRHHMVGHGGCYLCFWYDNGMPHGGLIGLDPFIAKQQMRKIP